MQEALTNTDERSPIVAIKQKELELAAELVTARQAAERTVAEAREWVASYLRQVERDARAFAATEYRTALEAVDDEAAAIRAAGQREAVAIARVGALQMGAAVGQILHIVVPRVVEHGTVSTPGAIVGQEAQVNHA